MMKHARMLHVPVITRLRHNAHSRSTCVYHHVRFAGTLPLDSHEARNQCCNQSHNWEGGRELKR